MTDFWLSSHSGYERLDLQCNYTFVHFSQYPWKRHVCDNSVKLQKRIKRQTTRKANVRYVIYDEDLVLTGNNIFTVKDGNEKFVCLTNMYFMWAGIA